LALCPADKVSGNDSPLNVNSELLEPAPEIVTADPAAVTLPVRFFVEPTVTVPKLSVAGDADKVPLAPAVPERGTLNVGFEAVEVIATLPLGLPADFGANVTVKVKL